MTLTDRLTIAVCDLVAAATGEPCPDPFRATARRLIAAELANTETRTTYSTGAPTTTVSSAGTVTVAPRVMADALANLDAATIRPKPHLVAPLTPEAKAILEAAAAHDHTLDQADTTPVVPAHLPAGAPIVMPRGGKGRPPTLLARLDTAGPLEVRRLAGDHGSTPKAVKELLGRKHLAGDETQQAKEWCAAHDVDWITGTPGVPKRTPAPPAAPTVDGDLVEEILTPFPLEEPERIEAEEDTPPAPRPTVVPDPPVVAQARVENGHGNVFGCSDCLYIAGRLDELGRHVLAKHHRQVANIERRPLDADEIAERVAEADRLVAERVS
jgi:hypothetical protein